MEFGLGNNFLDNIPRHTCFSSMISGKNGGMTAEADARRSSELFPAFAAVFAPNGGKMRQRS
jgi:hypothetical protein